MYTIPIYVENKEKSIFESKVENEQITKEKLKETIELFLENIKETEEKKEVAFFGGNFMLLDKELQNELLDTVCEYIKDKKINSIRISTVPQAVTKANLKNLKKHKVKTIELIAQTSNNYILKRCKIKYNFEDIKKASKLIKRYRFELGHQMVVGLPESTKLDELNTARDLAKLRPKTIRIFPMVVIKDSELAEEYEDFNPLTMNQAVERCKELYYYFTKKKIYHIHIGYQNADIIMNLKNKQMQILDGPYHEAFDQLVEDSVWYDNIVERIKKFNVKVKKVEISVHPNSVKNVKGYGNENIEKLKEIYDVEVEISEDEQKPLEKFEIKILSSYTDFLEERKEKD